MKDLNCLRCGVSMKFLGEEQLQLGKTGWLLGDLPNLFAGALEVELYRCPQCGKLELFSGEGSSPVSGSTCPECGAEYEGEVCPICGHET